MEEELLIGFYRNERNGEKKNMERQDIKICFSNGKECRYEECIDIRVNERDGLLVVDMSPRDEPISVRHYFPLCSIESFRVYCEF